jgi:aryl-alcohol dehydrogenase-like predicted oxidoreductase
LRISTHRGDDERMETRVLGGDGPAVSVVGLGCNNFGMKIDADAARAVVRAALDTGITHFDTAEMYGGGKSEEFLRDALGSRRDEVTIATKYMPRPGDPPYEPGALRRRITEGCEISLGRLGTDRIDLYYQHFPDPDAPIDEMLDALNDLVLAGKVLHVASSNVSSDQIDEAAKVAEARGLARFCATQIEWNLLSRGVEESVVPAARTNRLGVVPYFPLASGMLTGKYRRGEDFPEGSRFASMSYFASVANDENFDRVEALTEFAEARQHSVLELAVAWLAAQEGVGSVICGATTPEQVAANAAAADWRLSRDDLAAMPVAR